MENKPAKHDPVKR